MKYEVTVNGTVNNKVDVYTIFYNIEADTPQSAADFVVKDLADVQSIDDWYEEDWDDTIGYDDLNLDDSEDNTITISSVSVTVVIDVEERVLKLNID